MAKHFKEEPAQSTEVMSARKIRRTQQRVAVDGGTGHLPYGQAASYRASYADAAPTSEFYMGDAPARGGLHAVGRGLLLILAWAVRLVALCFVFLVLANSLSLPFFLSQLTEVTDLVTSYFPWGTLNVLMVDTPFGGVFRGDFAIIALLMFMLDWLLCRLRARLR